MVYWTCRIQGCQPWRIIFNDVKKDFAHKSKNLRKKNSDSVILETLRCFHDNPARKFSRKAWNFFPTDSKNFRKSYKLTDKKKSARHIVCPVVEPDKIFCAIVKKKHSSQQ